MKPHSSGQCISVPRSAIDSDRRADSLQNGIRPRVDGYVVQRRPQDNVVPMRRQRIFELRLHPSGRAFKYSGRLQRYRKQGPPSRNFQRLRTNRSGFLRLADEASLRVYPLLDMDALPTFLKERLALIGDAAHPFLPHSAQGGAQAIEDGVSLGVFLDRTAGREEVPTRLRLYKEARYDRATTIQSYTRIVGGDGVGSNDQAGKQLARTFPPQRLSRVLLTEL